ncbi:hypothetical protein NKR19_g2175 [Coniochaeta hoffmannii]|uniref:Uncharacterized protein n=1 Tax=Coniochaeta hoffmannii TaxID=91930 RepID=A0AA38VND2_9PEZI|nr:hypothetical protein NKR19_g2175 [Coniochaeta hoffmannii]
MVSTLLSSLVVLAGHLSLSQADGGSPLFAGQGYIQVVNASEWSKVDLANRLGCMSETGAFTLDDCGVFTKAEDNPGLTSRLGNCSWRDDTQPANVDAIYGQRNYAWVCREGVDNWLYYTFSNTLAVGTKYPVIFHGNLDGYGDVKDIPEAGEKLPLWEFAWGSEQFDVPPGHTKVVWVWVPVNATATP